MFQVDRTRMMIRKFLFTGVCTAALFSVSSGAFAQESQALENTVPRVIDMRWLDAKDEAHYKAPPAATPDVARPVNPPASDTAPASIAAAPAIPPAIPDEDLARAIENQAAALETSPAIDSPSAPVADDPDAPYNGGAVIPSAHSANPSVDQAESATVADHPSESLQAALEDTAADTTAQSAAIADVYDIAQTPVNPDPAGDLYMILEHTHRTNPFLKAQRERLRLSHEQVFEAESGWLPIVTSDADISSQYNEVEPGGSSDNVAKTVSVSVIQPVFRSGRTVNAVDRETAAAQAAYFDYVGEMQSTLLQTITTYINVVAARSEVELNLQNVTRLEEENTSTRQQFEVGQLTRTDVSQSDARLAEARSNVIRAEGALREALAVFRQVAGMDIPLDAFQFPDAARIPVSSSLDDALMAGQANHPSIIAAENRIKSSDAAIAASYSELMPEIAVNGALERGYSPHPGILDSESSAVVSLSATMPFYDAGVSRSRVRQSKINKYIQSNNRESASRAVRSNITSTWEDYTTAMAVLNSSMAQLEAARIAREGVYSEREVGTRTVLDALDADQELLDAQVALVDARRDLIVSKFALLEAQGALVPENLGFQRIISEADNTTAARKTARRFFSTDVKPMDNSQ